MSFSSWLRNLASSATVERRRSHRTPDNRAAFRPHLEALERRDVPSTLTVTNNLDGDFFNGPVGSLRAEIAAAQAGDTIVFDPGLNGQTITLDGSDLVINKNLTIQGPGAGQLTISGGAGNFSSSRVFEVDGALTNLNLSGLGIVHGDGYAYLYVGPGDHSPHPDDGFGGAILNYGTLTVSNCNLAENDATVAGGAIANYGTLTVSNCNLAENHAGVGGAIANYGTLTVSGSDLAGNFAVDGGGILNGATATVSNCTLSGNSAYYDARTSPLTSGGYGGGIDDGGTLIISGSTLSGNRASYTGGGLYVWSGAPVNLDSFTVANTKNNTPNNIVGSYTTTTTIPAAPSNLKAKASLQHGSVQVQLQWNDNSNNQTGYVVQRSSDGGVTWTSIVALSGNANKYTDTTAAPNTTYEYRVFAYNALGDSPFSNVVTVTTPL